MNQEFYLCTIDNHKFQYDDITKNKDYLDSYIYILKFEIIDTDIIEIKKIIYFADYYTGSRCNLEDDINKQLIVSGRKFRLNRKINLSDHNFCGQIEHMRVIEYFNDEKNKWFKIPIENYFFNKNHVINICMKSIEHLKYRPLLNETKEIIEKYKNNKELLGLFKKQIDELFNKYI
jgi:hypothetical protein